MLKHFNGEQLIKEATKYAVIFCCKLDLRCPKTWDSQVQTCWASFMFTSIKEKHLWDLESRNCYEIESWIWKPEELWLYLGHSLEEKDEKRTVEQQTCQFFQQICQFSFSAFLLKFCSRPLAGSTLLTWSLISTKFGLLAIDLPQFFGWLPSLRPSLAHFAHRWIRIFPHCLLLLSEEAVWQITEFRLMSGWWLGPAHYLPSVSFFSYASSSTLYPCQWVSD